MITPPVCVTANSRCTVSYRSQGIRPPNGRVAILAYAPGEENFTDAGTPTNNVYDAGEAFDDLGQPYLDKDENGAVAEDEKVFTIQRDIVDPNKAQYAISGHGAYGYYHSPMWDIASGMLMGSMLSRMFMPGYSPMYTTPYTTSPAARGALASQRSSYRAANPGKFAKSSSGRSYGSKGGAWGSGGSRSSGGGRSGGGRFGVRRPAGRKVVHLS